MIEREGSEGGHWSFCNLVLEVTCHCFTTVYFSVKDLFIYLLVERGGRREKERERNIHVQEKHRLAASCTPPTGDLALQPRHVPQPGIEPATLPFSGRCSTH